MTQASSTGTVPFKNPRLYAAGERAWGWLVAKWETFRSYFTDRQPTFRTAFLPMVILSSILYMRWLPTTNYIFDEQEALLGNPYVNQQFKYEDAIYRDFWGLPANASIGSYRPVPNYLWRGLVEVGERGQRVVDRFAGDDTKAWAAKKLGDGKTPPDLAEKMRTSWPQHLFNLFFHGINGALFVAMAWRVTRRKTAAWFAGTTFVCCALLTEAVSGVVGLADVLGGLGALLALAALGMRAHIMPFGVFLALTLGLFSKESAIVCIPLVPVAALLTAPIVHPERPARLARAALATIGTLAAFVLYVECRKRWFPSPLPAELHDKPELGASFTEQAIHDFMIWFHQAPLPKDPLNNPLVDAPTDLRVAGAMRVYFRGLIQVVFPWHLSGDYSSPQEPVPATVIFPESVLGWAATVGPLGAALGLWVVALKREWREREPLGPKIEPPDADANGWFRLFVFFCVLFGVSLFFLPVYVGFFIALLAALTLSFLTSFTATGWLRTIGVAPNLVDTLNRHKWPLIRFVLEAVAILVTISLARKMLGIGPGEMNKDMGDSNPEHNIIIPPETLQDALVYGAFAAGAFGAFVETLWRPRTTGRSDYRLVIAALGMVWLVVSYFPHSNMYVLLPTVRAERLWYFPVLGTTMLVALGLTEIVDQMKASRQWASRAWMIPAAFLTFQAGRAYWHATDYRDDLIFWRETKDAVPNSAKAHLNYSVMAGARGQMEIRLQESHIARNLAPEWAMAHIYTGDTLCRMNRPDEAWPHYARGFELGPNDKGLISLALQCLWDYKKLKEHEPQLRILSAKHPGSWLAHLANDTLVNGDTQGGVQREHKPRSYNQGPKKKEGGGESTETTETTETSEGGE